MSGELTEDELRRAMKEIAERPPSHATVHHPKCAAIKSGRVGDCDCGGWAFR